MKERNLSKAGGIVFWLLSAGLPLLTLLLVDAFGLRYSPNRMDGFALFFNGICCFTWIGLIAALVGIGLRLRVHWRRFVALALLIAATFQSYPYLLAWDSLRNADLDRTLSIPGRSTQDIPGVWPSPPEHNWRTQFEKDFNGDGQQEFVVIDHYSGLGSSNGKIINLNIYAINNNSYTEIFNQTVSEERYYDFCEGCPERESGFLGSNSTIQFLNMDADNHVEIFAHQVSETSPPNCRFTYYYDWENGLPESFYPTRFWLIERSLFFYGLPLIVLLSGITRKQWFQWGVLITSGLYFIWALVESWLSSGFLAWAIVTGLTIILLAWQFYVNVTDHSKRMDVNDLLPIPQ